MLAVVTSVRFLHGPPRASQYSSGRGTPGPPGRERASRPPAGDASGDAPWALSALPECFRQLRSARGSPAFAAAKIPAGARPVTSGAVIVVADCTLQVLPDEIRVSRGPDRLRIPPRARLLVGGTRSLVLDRLTRGREEVRVYAVADGAAPLVVRRR